MQFLVSMHDAQSTFDLRFGWKTFPPFAADLEKTDCLDRTFDLPYDLRGYGLWLVSHLVRKPGFAPGPFASRAKMLLLHHNPETR